MPRGRHGRPLAVVVVVGALLLVGCSPSLEAPPGDAQRHTETMHLVAHGDRLFAGLGQWMDPSPDGAQIWVKRSATRTWEVFRTTASLRVQALDSVAVPAELNRGVETRVLLTQFRDTTSSRLFWLRDAGESFDASFDLGSAASVRALGAHRDGASFLFFAGVDPTGVLRGTWNPATGTIDWTATPELTVPAGGINADKVTGFAECAGSVYVTIKTKLFRRHDGALAAGAPRWDLVYEAPAVGRGNSGLRGITCVDHLGSPALLASTEGQNASIHRFAPLPAPGVASRTLAPVLEATPRTVIRRGLARMGVSVPTTGAGSVSYVIAAYNEFLDTTVDGTPVQFAGVEWNYSTACPSVRPCLPGNRFDAAACLLVRTVPTSTPVYDFRCLGGPLVPKGSPTAPITSGEAFVAIRTIRPSPWQPGVLFLGGYDANSVTADGTAWTARTSATSLLGG